MEATHGVNGLPQQNLCSSESICGFPSSAQIQLLDLGSNRLQENLQNLCKVGPAELVERSVTQNLAGGRNHLNDHETALKGDVAEGVCRPCRANKPTNPNKTMKTLLCTRLALAGTVALFTHTAQAQDAWQTVADSEGAPVAAVDALTKDTAGNLYAAVSSSDAAGRTHALIRKSSDQGATWTVVEDFVSAARHSAGFLSLGMAGAGDLYAVGYAEDENGQRRWIVRKSGARGASWSTVDDFAWPGGQSTTAKGFAADATGNLYVAGFGHESPSSGKRGKRSHWLVRQSRDGGQTWSTVDDFSYSFSARAAAIISTSSGLFVAGSGGNGKPESGERWLVRKGTDDGAGSFRWQTVDEFQIQESNHGSDSRARGLGMDGRGNLYAVGQSYTVADGAISAH